MSKRIAIVNQRYGKEVIGGSEYYTRLIAQRLAERYEVEILTTTAKDHETWANEYPKGVEKIDGIPVRRFATKKQRKISEFAPLNGEICLSKKRTREQEEHWLVEQGPLVPELIAYIREHGQDYDVFVFVTYLYYPTVMGLREVADKSILIPTAHDEWPIYFSIYQNVFRNAKAMIFLTQEEQALVHKLFRNEEIGSEVVGVGIDVPDDVAASRFREKYSISTQYLTYVGRIENGKGCEWLIKYFLEYKKRNPGDLKLVLMGKKLIDIPKDPDIICLGFVSEQDKFDGVAGAKALLLPSAFESLSISVLEAMSIGTPVIVNGVCEVLKGHCIKSNAGLYYRDYFEFEGCVNYMLAHPEQVAQMQENAKQYVHDHYRWDVIMQQFDRIIETVTD